MHVHNTPDKKLVEYLRQLGLSTEETAAYLYLVRSGSQTVLSLSRGLQTGRTKLYPLLEELVAKKLVTVHERHYGTTYQAASPETISFLVHNQEQRSTTLRSGLSEALYALKGLQQASSSTSKIVEYHDLEGIKQMFWNVSQAQTDYFILELPGVKKQVGRHLREKTLSLLDKKSVTSHIATNQKSPPSPIRYITPATFTIKYETYVYDHIVALINYDGKEFYGVEIHNKPLAQQYAQLLSLLWQ